MAYYQRKRAEEHAVRTLGTLIKDAEQNGNWPRVLLFTGSDDSLISWAVKKLKTVLLDPVGAAFDLSSLDGADCPADEIIAACESYPIMSQRKLVLLRDCEFLSAQAKGQGADTAARLAEYIPSIPESTLLIITARSADRRRLAYKAIEKTGRAFDFAPLDDELLAIWMARSLAEFGKKAPKRDLLRFARQNGYGDENRAYTLGNIENDLAKAAALSESELLTFKELDAVSLPDSDTNAFRLLDSAFGGNKSDALLILHNSVDSKLPSKLQGTVLGFLGLLCSQLEIMLEAKERSADGQTQREIQAAMGVNEYRLRRAVEASGARSVPELKKALLQAYDIERMMRSGEMEPYLALELFIASL